MSSITACCLAKDEEQFIQQYIKGLPGLDRILVINDHSSDGTVELALEIGAQVVDLPFHIKDEGFARAANWALAQVRTSWALFLDADELMPEVSQLPVLTRYPEVDLWGLPRRKWLDFSKGVRTEYWSYPDWQPKFIRVGSGVSFEGEMHVKVIGRQIHHSYRGPHIEHLQVECRTPEKLSHRRGLYKHLASIQNVSIIGGDTLPNES